jgi:transposase
MAYSNDFRQAVAFTYHQCGSSRETAEQHHCSESWVRRLIQNGRERGTLEPRSTARHDNQRIYNDADEKAIRKLIKEKPDVTLAEVVVAIGKPIHPGNVCRVLQRMNLPRKKSPRMPVNRIVLM